MTNENSASGAAPTTQLVHETGTILVIHQGNKVASAWGPAVDNGEWFVWDGQQEARRVPDRDTAARILTAVQQDLVTGRLKATAEPAQDWYFTFGMGHEVGGVSVADMYVVINGTYDGARDQMVERFGNRWAFQYASAQAAGVERFGLTEYQTDPLHCPTCESPSPNLHPATQAEGEVMRICPDPFHGGEAA